MTNVKFEAVVGDITDQTVDAIVNAANTSLLGGGGVDGAIHRVGGPEILAACQELRATSLPLGLRTGSAVATTAGLLRASSVIHAVGPVYSKTENRSGLLAGAYIDALRVAGELGVRTIAFPAISAGAFGWPLENAAEIAVSAVRAAAHQVPTLRLVRFVLMSPRARLAFTTALDEAARV